MAANGLSWTWFEGAWHAGDVPIMGARTHAAWLGSSVFDGARAFEGVTPDLDLHCARLNRSAEALGLEPTLRADEIAELARDGIGRFASGTALYIRPMYWAEHDGPSLIVPDAQSTRFCLTLYEAPMPAPKGFSITLSPFRRPAPDQAPTDAKAGCLYPNSARALKEARVRGFDNCLMLDSQGHAAELATANIFMAKDGAAHTPAANGSFLDGITRRRVIRLLRGAGVAVHERALRYGDFLDADEIFSTGNYGKVMPVIRIANRDLQPGPIFHKARELYWSFAHA